MLPRTDIVYDYDSKSHIVIVRGRSVARVETYDEAEQIKHAALAGWQVEGHFIPKLCRCAHASGDGVHYCEFFKSWIAFHNGMLLEMGNPSREAAEALLVAYVDRVGRRAWAA